jgi:SAM-dependent methyltransferase
VANIPRVKRVVRGLVPYGRRAQLRALSNELTWRLYAGNAVECNVCGGRFVRFRRWTSDIGRPALACPRCGSLGRHRVVWRYLQDEMGIGSKPLRLMHVAPEPGISAALQRLPGVDYLSVDHDSALAMQRVDITQIPYPDESFDAVICNHVLEHVGDDVVALSELYRVLRPDGWALLQTPVDDSREVTVEDPTVTLPLERERLFGQEDHRRLYGRDYPERLERAGFAVIVSDYARTLPEADCIRQRLDLRETVYVGLKTVH